MSYMHNVFNALFKYMNKVMSRKKSIGVYFFSLVSKKSWASLPI